VFLASVLFERLLIRQALQSETAHFWLQRERDPAFPLPATLNLTGYIDAAPDPLKGLAPGFHDGRNGDELERAQMLAEGRPIRAELRAGCRLLVDAPEKVLSVLLGNLLRNAFSYTDAGEVVVEIVPHAVVIRDSGIGMSPDELRGLYQPFVRGQRSLRGGHGVGLTIVRRLSDRFGWPVSIDSEAGVGTRVEVRFPSARVEPLHD